MILYFREDGLSSVDIKSETDTLRPDSPEGPESLLNSKSFSLIIESKIIIKGCSNKNLNSKFCIEGFIHSY